MKPLIFQPEVGELVQVNWADRWQVYQRLQELAIPCWCATNQPLRVHIADVTAAVQLWSVLRQFTTSRQDLVWWLERCWQDHACS
nr:Asr1405/Asl0597 family protein [Chroococcidiopsis sp. CCMEE 29]